MAGSDEDKLATLREDLNYFIMEKYGEGCGNPTANIVILGELGHGKSALINTLVKAILGEFYEVAKVGEGKGSTKTKHLQRYTHLGIEPYMWKIAKRLNKGMHVSDEKFFSLLPNITDFAGINEQMIKEFEEILKLLILGYIPLGTSIEYILAQQKKVGIVTGKVHVVMTMYDRFDKRAVNVDKDVMTAEDADKWKMLKKKEVDLAHAFSNKGVLEHSSTMWISVCDEVGYDNIHVDIRALQFLYELLKHPDIRMDEEEEKATNWFSNFMKWLKIW